MMLQNGLAHQTKLKMIKDWMNKKVIGLFQDELGGKIMIVFVAFRPKTYSYLMDDHNNH